MFKSWFAKEKAPEELESEKQMREKVLHETIDNRPLDSLADRINTPSVDTDQFQQFAKTGHEGERVVSPTGWASRPNNTLSNTAPADPLSDPSPKPPRRWSLNKLLGAAALICLVVFAIAIWLWSQDRGGIDPEKVIFRAIEPVEVVAATDLELAIMIENLNKTTLANATLITRYGEGGYGHDGSKITRTGVGTIQAGSSRQLSIPIVLNGSIGDEVLLEFELEYSLPDSANKYSLDYEKEMVIEKSPLSLRTTFHPQQTVGETLPFEVVVSATAPLPDGDFMIEFDVPNAIDIRDVAVNGSPAAALEGEAKFSIPYPSPGQSIKINGEIVVENTTAGLAKLETYIYSDKLIVAKQTNEVSIVLSPLLFSNVGVTNLIAGREATIEFELTNTTDSVITGAVVDVVLDGQVTEIKPTRGVYLSDSNTVRFDSSTYNTIGSIRPGQQLDLSFKIIPIGSQLIARLTATGLITEQGITRRELAKQTFDYPVEPALSVKAFATYRRSNTANTGPLPPVVGQRTTYTITLETNILDSSLNPEEIRALIPPNVKISDLPRSVEVQGDQLIWNNPSRGDRVAFQAALVPSSVQVGTIAALLENVVFEYVDRSNTVVSQPVGTVTTRLSQDSAFNESESIVVAP